MLGKEPVRLNLVFLLSPVTTFASYQLLQECKKGPGIASKAHQVQHSASLHSQVDAMGSFKAGLAAGISPPLLWIPSNWYSAEYQFRILVFWFIPKYQLAAPFIYHY